MIKDRNSSDEVTNEVLFILESLLAGKKVKYSREKLFTKIGILGRDHSAYSCIDSKTYLMVVYAAEDSSYIIAGNATELRSDIYKIKRDEYLSWAQCFYVESTNEFLKNNKEIFHIKEKEILRYYLLDYHQYFFDDLTCNLLPTKYVKITGNTIKESIEKTINHSFAMTYLKYRLNENIDDNSQV